MQDLICVDCGQCYEIPNYRSHEKFECECGGKLIIKPEGNYSLSEIPQRMTETYQEIHALKMAKRYKLFSILSLIIGIIGLIILFTSIRPLKPNLILFSLILLVICYFSLSYSLRKFNSWDRGAKGEIKVAQYLDGLPQGYYIFNDVKIPTMKGNIDHIVAGKTGIFVIETKNYKGRYEIDGDRWEYSDIGRSNRFINNNPANQAKIAAKNLNGYLKSETGDNFWINSIVASANNNFYVGRMPNHCEIMDANHLVYHIIRVKNNISNQDLEKISNINQPYCNEFSYFD